MTLHEKSIIIEEKAAGGFHMAHRRIIGVISTRTADTEQRELLQGIIPAAWAQNTDVVAISNIYNPEYDDEKLAAENDIYNLIASPDLCGLILITESFINPTNRAQITALMNARVDIPQVAVGSDVAGFHLDHCLMLNTSDADDLADMTTHLIEVHGFTEIDLLTGFDNSGVSHRRVEGYRRALAQHGIAFDESHVIFGDFWMPSGKALAESYIDGTRKMPQAVICANDYMAYGLLDTLAENGISVPDTLTVVGYEFVRERHYHTPILTTFQRNRQGIGKIAVDMLLHKLETGTFGSFVPPHGRVICGDSCTCDIGLADLTSELRAARIKKDYEFLHLYNQLEQRLTEAQSMEEFRIKFIGSEYLLRNVKRLDLCLYQHWYEAGITDDTIWDYPIYDDTHSGEISVFPRLSLSSLTSRCPHPAVYYCSPLFFSDHALGFAVTRYDTPETYDPVFRTWIKAVSNALEFLCMKNDIQYLMECQNLSDYQDTMTGLLNRKGFAHELHLQVRQTHPQVWCLLLQAGTYMDMLTLDNKSAEIASAKEIADILRKLAKPPMLCARLEQNLYAVAGIGESTGMPLLKERITAMLLHSPNCFALYGVDSCVLSDVQTEYESSTALLHLAEQALSKQVQRAQEIRQKEHYEKFIPVRTQLYQSEDGAPTVEQLCRHYLISAGHFRKIYKETFGIAYHQDEIRKRMLHMVYLLTTTTLDLSAIVSRCGYDDYGYCLRLFRQFTGYTPNQYRKMN